jgi:hypothetical protein
MPKFWYVDNPRKVFYDALVALENIGTATEKEPFDHFTAEQRSEFFLQKEEVADINEAKRALRARLVRFLKD